MIVQRVINWNTERPKKEGDYLVALKDGRVVQVYIGRKITSGNGWEFSESDIEFYCELIKHPKR